ncbi:MAG: hypothetical protein IPN34_03930 [Planctomycetes bacterium]|nr:hypothetical protein [Planctomycetota bacterium]
MLERALAFAETWRGSGERFISQREIARDLGMHHRDVNKVFKGRILRHGYFVATGKKRGHWDSYSEGPALVRARRSDGDLPSLDALGSDGDSALQVTAIRAPSDGAEPSQQQQEQQEQQHRRADARGELTPLAETRRGAALEDVARGKKKGVCGAGASGHVVAEVPQEILGAFARWSYPSDDEQRAKQRVRDDSTLCNELARIAEAHPRLATWQAALASSSRTRIRNPIAWMKTVLPNHDDAPESRDYGAGQRIQNDERLNRAREAAEEASREDRIPLEPIGGALEGERLMPDEIIQHDDGRRAAFLLWDGGKRVLQVWVAGGGLEDIPEADLGRWHRTTRAPSGEPSSSIAVPLKPVSPIEHKTRRVPRQSPLLGRGAEFMQERMRTAKPEHSPENGTPEIASMEMPPAPQ